MPPSLPNPPFVFPAQDPNDASPQSSPVDLQPKTPPALPAFSFNPGSGHEPQPSSGAPPSRGGGHRRRYSEFVGGDRLVSPEAAEDSHPSDEKPTPTPAPAPAPAKLPPPNPGFAKGGHGRRGHAHRRSAAVSSVDLSAISNALDTKPSPDSAPCTPADAKREHALDDVPRPMSYSATGLNHPTPPASPLVSAAGNLPGHMDFGISNDSRTAGQPSLPAAPQISDSISDQPGDTAVDSGRPVGKSELTSNPTPRTRPKTADALLSFEQRETGMPGNFQQRRRPISATAHSRAHKSLSSGVLDLALRKMKAPGDDFHVRGDRRHSEAESLDASGDDTDESCESSPTAKDKAKSKKKKRQEKVRSWAGAILTRNKGKSQQPKETQVGESSKRPPVLTRTNSDVGSGLDVDFDDDNIVVIQSPTNPNAPKSSEPDEMPTTPTLENAWKPRSFYEQCKQDDTQSPIIDLDAALGPFNTPELRPGFVAGSNFSAASRRMYSGGRRGEFIGPEMRYHRRAESAPEMPPFDRSFMPGNRLATNSAMENADVFYEEDEDAFLAASGQSPEDDGRPPSSPSGVVHADSNDNRSVKSMSSSDTLTRHTAGYDKESQHTGLGIRRNASDEVSPDPPSSGHEERKAFVAQSAVEQVQQAKNPFNQTKSPVDIIRQEKGQNRAPAPSSPDVSPGFLPVDKRPATSPTELGPSIPHLSLHDGPPLPNSSFPSPDLNGYPSDATRSIATPSTTTTDRKLSGPSFNMPMDRPHGSIEDVPSLTSSASTTTTRMHRFSASFLPHSRRSGDRSASFSAGAARRSSQASSVKRSSFASLSKLVAGPHAERSKLCHEEKPPGDAPEKAKKKGRRISRLMHFWRMKDKGKPSENAQG
ncbi:hypothetical protein PHISP_08304 [Aspergillus sp. HF37]|nr:hypothetical protein PHISP_08304 [Aspergillus sp. HF37]